MDMENYLLPVNDGLPVRVFGTWTTEKLDYLKRYIYMFETSMRGKPWRQRNYIDLFVGKGKFCGEEQGDTCLGSPLIALTTEHPFTHYYFVDQDPENIATLRRRCQFAPQAIQYYVGDANQKVKRLLMTFSKLTKSIFLDSGHQ